MNIDPAAGSRCTQIRECRSSEAVSQDIKLYGPGEEIEVAPFISVTAGVQRDSRGTLRSGRLVRSSLRVMNTS